MAQVDSKILGFLEAVERIIPTAEPFVEDEIRYKLSPGDLPLERQSFAPGADERAFEVLLGPMANPRGLTVNNWAPHVDHTQALRVRVRYRHAGVHGAYRRLVAMQADDQLQIVRILCSRITDEKYGALYRPRDLKPMGSVQLERFPSPTPRDPHNTSSRYAGRDSAGGQIVIMNLLFEYDQLVQR